MPVPFSCLPRATIYIMGTANELITRALRGQQEITMKKKRKKKRKVLPESLEHRHSNGSAHRTAKRLNAPK